MSHTLCRQAKTYIVNKWVKLIYFSKFLKTSTTEKVGIKYYKINIWKSLVDMIADFNKPAHWSFIKSITFFVCELSKDVFKINEYYRSVFTWFISHLNALRVEHSVLHIYVFSNFKLLVKLLACCHRASFVSIARQWLPQGVQIPLINQLNFSTLLMSL